MPAPWIDQYLNRLGYTADRTPSLATLRALHELHLLRVPFENLDIHWNRPIVVDAWRFLQKIVGDRRGGFCYELNGAFATLLRELGFDVTLLSGRVPTARGEIGPPFDHMALLVRLSDGSRWLADVGFGDCFFSPLNLDDRGEQRDRNGVYRIDAGDEWRLVSKHDGEWTLEYLFTLEPHALNEYGPMCDYQQYSPDSHFRKGRVCTMATETGRVTLTDSKLIITHDGVKDDIPVPAEDWSRVLEETFGIADPLCSAP